MDVAGKIAIAKQVMAQIEMNLEAAAFEARLCVKVGDEKSLGQIKARVSELQRKVDAGMELIKEMQAASVKAE